MVAIYTFPVDGVDRPFVEFDQGPPFEGYVDHELPPFDDL